MVMVFHQQNVIINEFFSILYMEFESPNKENLTNNLLTLSPLSRSLLLPIIKNQTSIGKSKFQNGYATQKFFNRYARTEYLLAGSVTVNFSMLIIYFELSIREDPLKEWILYLSLVFQFFCIFVLIINHVTFNDYKMHQNHHYETKKFSQLVLYSIFLLLKPYPFLEEYQISFANQLAIQNHKVNHLLCLSGFLQIFLIIPCFFVSSKYQSLRSQRISDLYGSRASYVYALKCWFKQNSVSQILLSFVFWFGFCVFGIRIAEYQNNSYLKSFQNSVWLTFITMSTVGFGDLATITNVGYIISTITMYSGVMVTSIIVLLLRDAFELNSRQKRTLKILKNLEQKNQLKLLASRYIRESLWRIWRNKKNRHNGIHEQAGLTERNYREQFKVLRIITQKNNFQSNIRDEFKHNFAKIYGYMDNLKQNQDRIINFLQNSR